MRFIVPLGFPGFFCLVGFLGCFFFCWWWFFYHKKMLKRTFEIIFSPQKQTKVAFPTLKLAACSTHGLLHPAQHKAVGAS